MRSNQQPRQLIVAALLLLSLFGIPALRASGSGAQQPLVVFVVRHAEKANTDNDPDLTIAGRLRAAQLAALLRQSGITHVHSSDTKRTQATAGPTAAALGVEVEEYDPGNLPRLVDHLGGTGGRHLVVGHSNTTPDTVELLGGEPGPAIDDKTEFDRLYIVGVSADGAVTTVLLRYGAPSGG